MSLFSRERTIEVQCSVEQAMEASNRALVDTGYRVTAMSRGTSTIVAEKGSYAWSRKRKITLQFERVTKNAGGGCLIHASVWALMPFPPDVTRSRVRDLNGYEEHVKRVLDDPRKMRDTTDIVRVKLVNDDSYEMRVRPVDDDSYDLRVKPVSDDSYDMRVRLVSDNSYDKRVRFAK